YPISDEFSEVSATNGQVYQVQYFERAVFEYHPELRAPNNVLLSLLGAFSHDALYTNIVPGDDYDNDGYTNSEDTCPYAAEVNNGVFDDDGCPDSIQTLM